jgi:hypothetical protein
MKVTIKKALALGHRFKVDFSKTPFTEWHFGLNVEIEHINILKNNYYTLARIAKAHIDEKPRYYYYIKKYHL